MYKTTSSRHTGQHQRLIYYLFSGKTEIHSFVCANTQPRGMWLLIPHIERGSLCSSCCFCVYRMTRTEKPPNDSRPDASFNECTFGWFVGLCISSAQGDEMSCVRLTSEEPQARPPLSNSPLQQYKQQERQYK